MRQTVGFLACVASASAFLSGPAAVPGTARYNGAVTARSGLGLRAARPAVALRKNNAAALSMQTATGVDTAALAKAANEARGLAMDSIAAAASGHLGLPLGCAEVMLLAFSPAHLRLLLGVQPHARMHCARRAEPASGSPTLHARLWLQCRKRGWVSSVRAQLVFLDELRAGKRKLRARQTDAATALRPRLESLPWARRVGYAAHHSAGMAVAASIELWHGGRRRGFRRILQRAAREGRWTDSGFRERRERPGVQQGSAV